MVVLVFFLGGLFFVDFGEGVAESEGALSGLLVEVLLVFVIVIFWEECLGLLVLGTLALFELGVLLHFGCLELLAVGSRTLISFDFRLYLRLRALLQNWLVFLRVEAVVHVDVVEGLVKLSLVLVGLLFLLLLEVVLYLGELLRFLLLDLCFLGLHFGLNLFDLRLFEFLSLILDFLDFLFHARGRLFILFLVDVFVVELDFGYFFEFDLGDFLVDIFEFGLVLLLQLILLLLDGCPYLLDPLLELLLKFLQLIFVEKNC